MQKLSLVLLLLSLTFCFGQYQPLNIAEASASPEIQNLIQFGLQAIEQDATRRGLINDTNFTLDNIYNVSEDVAVRNGSNYRFNVSFTNPNGNEIYARFTIHVDSASNNNTLLFLSYRIDYPNQANNTIQTAPIPRARDALLYGVKQVLLAGRRRGNIPPGNYILTQVANNSVQVLANNKTAYTFSVALNNTRSAAFVTANFTVDYDPTTRMFSLYSYSFRAVREIPLTAPNFTNATAPITIITPSNVTTPSNITTANNTAVIVPLPVSNLTNNTAPEAANNTQAANNTSPIFVVSPTNPENVVVIPNNYTNTTPPVNNTAPPSNITVPLVNLTTPPANATNVTNFVPIPNALIAQDQFYQILARLGAERLIPLGIQSGQIPNVNYNAVQILSIGQEAVLGGQLYQVHALLLSPNNVTATLTFNVFERRPANQLLLVNQYTFNS